MRPVLRRTAVHVLATTIALFCVLNVSAQDGKTLYPQLKAFKLDGSKVDVNGAVVKCDRGEFTLTGTIYFEEPVSGKITGAVFKGTGLFRAAVPDNTFERDNVKRLLGVTDKIEADFTTAVFRFTDDSFAQAAEGKTAGTVPPEATAAGAEFEPRFLKETGVNVSARLALSMLDQEDRGFFIATLDGGKSGRFTYLFDPQTRIPSEFFEINAAEKGLIIHYDSMADNNDIWMAFRAQEDYDRKRTEYSDMYDLVDITNYAMDVDLTHPKTALGLKTRISMTAKKPNVSAITFVVGENLPAYDNMRLKKQMHVKNATFNGQPLPVVQEDWEGGFTVFLPTAIQAGQSVDIGVDLEGDFMQQPVNLVDCNYPLSNDSWYPRHGYLDRATFDLTYTGAKKLIVASSGTRVSEGPDPANKDQKVTKYSMKIPIPLATFAIGPFERHADTIKWDNGDKPTPLEFSSMSGSVLAIKEDFILAEMNNAVRYFQAFFGKYPYETYGGVFHPFNFGQGFATMLTIPNTDRATKNTFAFIAHETSHQWWGNIVSWRSYRDQWLSEGFAEYSGVLYTSARQDPKSAADLMDTMRRELKEAPETQTGIAKGRLVDVGPLIAGRRLETKKTYGAYTTLIYSKGALVLRMIQYLLSDPSNQDDKIFVGMMRDFVNRYRDKFASTEDFALVAGQHFARSPLGQKYNLKNLDWFFDQWVNGTALPSYGITYHFEDQPDGSTIVRGEVTQDNAPENWFMPLPVKIRLKSGQVAWANVAANGPKAPFAIKVPSKPEGLDLDPDHWVLSDKMTVNK